MSSFKFNCPQCGDRMEAGQDHVGLEIDCPHCQAHITIPGPWEPKDASGGKDAGEEAKPAKESAKEPAKEPAKESAKEPAKPAASAPSKPAGPAPGAAQEKPPETQVASVNTELKQAMVAEVRRMLADGSQWIPGLNEKGKHVLSAKKVGEAMEPLLPEQQEEATHYSIIGAFQKVMADRNVMVTASGRSRFLGVEIPEAANRVLNGGSSGGGRLPDEKNPDPMSLDHGQCLKLLDQLDASYAKMMDNRVAAEQPKKTSTSDGDPLSKLLDKDGEIDVTELAAAVSKVVRSLQDRLKAAEGRIEALSRKGDD